MMKGQAFRGFFDAYERLFDTKAREKLIAELPEVLSNAARFGAIVSSGWYPISWYCSLYDTLAKNKLLTPDLARKIGRDTTALDIKGVYSFVLRFANPTTVFANVNRILGLYVQQCEATVVERTDGLVRVRMKIPGSSRWLWEEFSGGAEVILDACGAKNTRCSCTGQSNDEADLEAHWMPKGT